ncbi:acyltransferase family protein [Pseudonocardia phyllosphaerae]|uniref:acyltransferase family protein n=1 Tax=Pseudonocardia phyllosphaerae TaxID=3390502 RepID=UPI00397C8DB6
MSAPTAYRTPAPPTPVAPQPPREVRQERFALDGYRAVAAIAVLIFHVYQFNRSGPASQWPLEGSFWHGVLTHTDLAVDMFFVLSGLVLGLPFAKAALGRRAPQQMRRFLMRRTARLIPLYFVVVMLVWTLTNPDLPGHWTDLVLHLTFTQVWSTDYIFWTDGPAWTLACEMHFLALLALLGAWAQSRVPRITSVRARYAVLTGGVAVLIAAGVGYRFWAMSAGVPGTQWAAWFNPLAKLDVFALGLALSIVAASGVRIRRASVRALLVLAAVAAVAGTTQLNPMHGAGLVATHLLSGLACVLLLSSSVLAPRQPRWLATRPMVFLGTIGYGIYLWQEPVLRVLSGYGLLARAQPGPAFLVEALFLFAVTVCVAWVGYHVIERTALHVVASVDEHGRRRDYYPEPGPPPEPVAAR